MVMYRLGFQVEFRDGELTMTPDEFAGHLVEALPPGWWEDETDDVIAVFPLNDDGSLRQADSRLRPPTYAEQKQLIEAHEMLKKSMTEEVARAQRAQQALQCEVNELKTDRDILKERMRSREATIQELDRICDEKERAIKAKGEEAEDLRLRLKATEEKAKILGQRLNECEANLDRYRDDNDGLAKALNEMLDERKGKAMPQDNAEKVISQIIDILKDAGFTPEGFMTESELSDVEGFVEDAKGSAAAAESTIENVRREIEDLTYRLEEAESEVSNVYDQLGNVETVTDSARTGRS